MVYLDFVASESPSASQSSNASASSTGSARNGVPPEEDEIDKKLFPLKGLIDRNRDERLCQHGAKGRCLHCTPLEPYNEGYLTEHNIKHMSFHAYLRKLTSGADG